MEGQEMIVVLIVIVAVALILAILFIIGALAAIGAVDDAYRDYDDREQEAYIRRWNEDKQRKREAKEARRKPH